MVAGRVALTAVAAALWLAPSAQATPVSAARATVEITYTTTVPGAPTGFTYAASFRNPADPGSDPPSLRRLVIRGAPGSLLDTTAIARCAAEDAELKQRGQPACPAASRLGGGAAQVRVPLLPPVAYRTTLFNADHDQLELLEGDAPSPPVVVHGRIKGELLDSPIPTCLNGGYPPADCPSDQVALASNRLVVPAVVTGRGAQRRSYMTTPPACPPSRRWRTPVVFFYGDGAIETLVTEQPCVPATAARPRLALGLRVPRARVARRLRRLRVAVRVRGAARADKVRVALRRVNSPGRVLGRTRRPVAVRGRRLVTLRLSRPGLSRGRYELAARAPGLARITRRFTIR